MGVASGQAGSVLDQYRARDAFAVRVRLHALYLLPDLDRIYSLTDLVITKGVPFFLVWLLV
jgi:hypothetical protein